MKAEDINVYDDEQVCAATREDRQRDHSQVMRGYSNMPAVMQQMGFDKLREGQPPVINSIMAGNDTICILPTGCHAKGQLVMLYDGNLKKVEEVEVGDLLMGPDSKPRKVIRLARGRSSMVRIVPVKGEPFEVNEDHILTLIRVNEKSRNKYPSDRLGGTLVDVSVREWKTWTEWKKHIHKLVRVSVDFPHSCQPAIDPYFIGLYLGDGDLGSQTHPRIHSREPEIEEYLSYFSEDLGMKIEPISHEEHLGFRVVNSTLGCKANLLKDHLVALGLKHCGSETKFIPTCYKLADRFSRLRLIAGLMDSDGSLSCNGYDYVSKSKELAEDTAFLARSVGLAAYVVPCKKTCKNTGVEGDYFRVSISGDADMIPCIVRSKIAKPRKQKKNVLVTGFDVLDVEDAKYYGFSLTGDGRFLLGDFTVTHNTGKTATFVIPSLALGWKTIVFSPLVALMRDQVQSLWKKGIKAGALSSLNTDTENHRLCQLWARGELDFLYVAPERLRNEAFKMALQQRSPDHCAIDEAHTISQWSDNFRPEYRMIGPFVDEHRPYVVSAFTATAPREVINDIKRVLGIEHANTLIYYPRRTNLNLHSRLWNGAVELASIIRGIPGSIIVYCATKEKGVEAITKELQRELGDNEVTFFHGGLTPALKRTNQEAFMSGQCRIVVATNAFGMGIDKPDIRAVIHRDMPGSIEQLAQEVGRAGRDGLPSKCIAMYDENSLRTQEFFIDAGNPNKSDVTSVFKILNRSRGPDGLVEMTQAQVAEMAGVNKMFCNAIFSQLAGANVIERFDSGNKVANVKFLNHPEAKGRRYGDFKELIPQGGIEKPDGSYDIDLNYLSEEAGVGHATVTKYMRDWSKEGWIAYNAPFRGATTRIIGDLSLVDFERLKEKAKKDRVKLEAVKKYFNTSDDEKHNFLEEYFMEQHAE
jgi:hypothetical protein